MENLTKKIIRAVGSTTSVIVHTVLFLGAFMLPFFGVTIDRVLLVLTTLVSLEAIYLALFIQMSVTKATESLENVEEDIEEVQKEIDDIAEDIEEVQKEVDDIAEDIEEVQKDIDDIAEDIEEEDTRDETHDEQTDVILANIQRDIAKLLEDIERLKKGK